LLVRDVTRRHLFGSDDKFNYNIDSPSDGKLPWSQLLTVFSAEKDVTPEGEARTDLNGADLSFLYDELASRLDTQTAAFLVYYRQYGPATDQQVETARNNGLIVSDTAAMTTLAGSKSDGATEAKPDCTLPAAFTLKTPLDVVGASVLVPVSPTSGTGSDAASTVSSEPQYRLITSPITVSRGDSKKLFRFLDYASTSPGTVIIGRVNINEAPRTVLEAIPDLTRSDVQQILSSRPSPENGIDDDHRHAAWLYTKGIVNLEKMKGLWNKITTGGDVYRGQVIGFLDKNLASNRAEIVLDNTVSPPRQVFHKDLTAYGAGFPNEILLGTQSEKNKPIGDFSPAVTNGYFELDLPKPNSNPFSDIDGQIKNDNNSRMNSGQNTPRNTLSGIDLNDTADTLLSDQARNTGPAAVSQTGNRNRTAGKQDVPPSVSDSNADGMPDETGIPGISGMPETGGQTMDGTGNGQLSAADGDSETGLTRNQRLINALQERRQKRNANKSPTE
ncbi:MAG: hypothetical protein IKW74_06870, partial [Thermoguttaceae bacterium]|nr:hypothetical protein [Thermoguttaceae bacterium]